MRTMCQWFVTKCFALSAISSEHMVIHKVFMNKHKKMSGGEMSSMPQSTSSTFLQNLSVDRQQVRKVNLGIRWDDMLLLK